MEVTLINTDSCSPQQEFTLDDLPVIIGRSVDAGVRLSDPTVSRRHCGIEEMEGVLVVRDLGSRNGTYVNGYRITEALLMPGHKLSMGASCFHVFYERGTATPQPCVERDEVCQYQES